MIKENVNVYRGFFCCCCFFSKISIQIYAIHLKIDYAGSQTVLNTEMNQTLKAFVMLLLFTYDERQREFTNQQQQQKNSH